MPAVKLGQILQNQTDIEDIVSGSTPASKAATLNTPRDIDGLSFDGSANINHYTTCNTVAATVAKTVTLSGYSLQTGSRAMIKFTYKNTADAPTMNINSTGAKLIKAFGTTESTVQWVAGDVVELIYDGTNYIMFPTMGMMKDLDDAVDTINTKLTVNYGTCTTYSATATYALNALVIYSNKLYKCTTAITVAEAWNSAKWTAIADTNNGTVYNTTDSSFYGVRGADSVLKKLGSGNIAVTNNFSTGNTTVTVQATATADGKASLYFAIVASSVWGSVTVKHNNTVLNSGSYANWTTQGSYIVDCKAGDTFYISVYGNGLECGVIAYPII